jgi:predicted PurR-regulated permease PerM
LSDNSQSNPIPFWSARQVILATIFVVAVFLAFWLLFSYRYIILLFFISVVLGIAIRPLVDWLMRRGLSRTNALLITFIALLAAIVAFLLLLVPILTTQLIELSSRVPEVYDQARVFLVNSESRFIRNLAYRLPQQIGLLLSQPASESDPLAPVNQLFTIAGLALRGIFSLIAVLLLAFSGFSKAIAFSGIYIFSYLFSAVIMPNNWWMTSYQPWDRSYGVNSSCAYLLE